ncbi:MAG: DEAD/DEAH box helicase family protein [Clostridia bacterium]|nr:DEAD/DEAH box helicase family protein [Clostridia bacterium]
MAEMKNAPAVEQLDPVELAKEKRSLYRRFFGSVKDGGEVFSPEDIDIAIESLRFAQMDIRARLVREQQEKEAEQLRQKMEQDKKRREAAQLRAARRAQRRRERLAQEIATMQVPEGFVNAFEGDHRANVHCDSISDALFVSIDSLGMVDIEFIASITGEEMKTVIETLRGSIFQNPLFWNECFYKGWETAEEYLSGNLTHKYQLAEEANEQFPGIFDANLEALKQVMNPELDIYDIYITLGSPWVPTDIIDDFILHLVELDPVDGVPPAQAEPFLAPEYAVQHDDYTGFWEIPEKTRFRKSREHGRFERFNYSVWGTPRMEMLTLLENVLNMKTLAVFDTKEGKNGKKTRLLNQEETVKVLEKQKALVAEFQSWVWQDEHRRNRLQGSYCRKFGSIKRREFDGSFLEFPDINPNIELRPHQKNSVARIIFSPNTLLAHDVGAGKTFTMIAAGMELRRLGKSQKNMYVIPNNIMPQWVQMFHTMYPDAKLLTITNKNFNQKKRYATLKLIMDEDFDAILITYSCFDMLSLSKKYYKDLYLKQLERLEKAREKNPSKSIAGNRARVLELLDKLEEDAVNSVCEIPFDDLGINTLFVDEAHNYKNVSVASRITRVRGISTVGSKKCDGMMDKIHCVQRQNNGGRVVLATGTPITNSITDLFVMQKYLQEGELEFMGIHTFDAWVGMFGKKTTEFEIDVDTNSYRLATRFSRFYNVPELTAVLSSIADFYHIDQSDGLPRFDGYTDIVRVGDQDFKEFLADISTRADDVRNKRVEPKVDNLLKITTDGRKAALDMRLIDMVYGLSPDSKVFQCARQVVDIYEKTRDQKRIQMVFCDTSTPKLSFNLYDELKKILIAMGIPENEIAFIHDADNEAKKRLLFSDLQKGLISVVVGSTFKMGLGVNVQERLCALHHLDVPWRPADMVQREGRILRQGNRCEEVQIFRYITRGSFDAYSWQLLESKQKFISQILSGRAVVREGDDVDESVLSYAEVKALAVGNPLIKERVEQLNELDKYRILQRDYQNDLRNKERRLRELPQLIEDQKKRIHDTELDIAFYQQHGNNYEEMSYEEQKAIRDAIYAAVKTHIGKRVSKQVLTYQGFSVVVPEGMQPKLAKKSDDEDAGEKVSYVFVKRNGSYYMEVQSCSGITKRLNNLLDGLVHEKRRRKEGLQDLLCQKAAIEEALQLQGNDYALKIEQLMSRLEEIDYELGVMSA